MNNKIPSKVFEAKSVVDNLLSYREVEHLSKIGLSITKDIESEDEIVESSIETYEFVIISEVKVEQREIIDLADELAIAFGRRFNVVVKPGYINIHTGVFTDDSEADLILELKGQ